MGTLRRVPWDRLARGGRALVFCGLLMLGVAGMLSRWGDVFADKDIYFLDPDCYSRMTRAAMILHGEGPSLRFHTFENAPLGVTPHTTAPLDLLIAGASRLTGSLDTAGAWISPVFGMVFLVGAAIWSWRRKFGGAALTMLALSPVVAHGFSIGRPDHQGLLMLLVGVGLVSEWALWNGSRRAGWISALAWAMALWVSLYEPLVMLVLCLALRGIVLQRNILENAVRPALVFGALCCAFLTFDGLRLPPTNPDVRAYFGSWAATIGELRSAGWTGIVAWAGWLAPVAPALLAWQGFREKSRRVLALAALLGLLLALTFWSARWGYFLVIGYALALPVVLARFRSAWLAWPTLVVSLWPVASAWDRDLFPEGESRQRRQEMRAENVLLRSLTEPIRQLPPGPILAPWWVSPALAYWSGRAFVAGSSHQSLPGIVFTARFYTESSPERAQTLLAERGVAGVVGDDPNRLLETSGTLLSLPPSRTNAAMAVRLTRHNPPPFLKPVATNAFFSLWKVEK